jgi:GSH-dependent disulfide-bond oxidoreductase
MHLRAFASDAEGTYAYRRFEYEAHRHWKVLEDHLSKNQFVCGDTYTVADMAMWGYTRMGAMMFGFDTFQDDYPNIKRLTDWINERPAAAKVAELAEKYAENGGGMDAAAIKHLFAYAQPGDLVFN